MPYIGQDLQVAYQTYKNIDDISGSFNGSTTSFSLLVGGVAPVPLPLNSQQCLISVGGVIQRPDDTGAEGFRLSGGNIVFSSAPGTGEDFFGVILAGADYVNVGANFPSGSAAVPSITFDSDLDTGIYNSGANQVSVTTSGTERFRVDSSGQIEAVSLGTAAAPTWSFTTDPNTGIYSPGADQVAISTNGSGRLFVNSSGSVGIGTSSPSNLFHVSGTAGTPVSFERTGSNGIFIGLKDGSGNNVFLGNTNGVFSVQTPGSSFSDKLVITSAGLVGIGTTNSVGKLTVATSSADPSTALSAWSDGYFVVTPGGTTTSGGIGLSFNTSTNIGGISCAAPGSAWRDLIYKASAHRFELGGSEAARIDSSGRLLVGTSSSAMSGGVVQQNGNLGIIANTTTNLANNGTLDITINSGGGCFTGFLIVENTLSSNAAVRTQTLYAVMGRGTSATFTSLATVNGGSGGATFTVTAPSNGVIRLTNTVGNPTNVNLCWYGPSGY